MPYARDEDLPPAVRNHLPPHAQEIFRNAFNHAPGRPIINRHALKKSHIGSLDLKKGRAFRCRLKPALPGA